MRVQRLIPLRGRTNGLDPAAGEVGEYKTAVLAAGAATALLSATPKTIVSLSVTGDWDVWGTGGFLPAATTNVTLWAMGLSLVDNSLPAQDDGTRTDIVNAPFVPGLNAGCRLPVSARRVNVNVATNVYLVAADTHTVSTMGVYGREMARRRS